MDSVLTQLGVGAIFVVLVLRMILDFLGAQRRNGPAGEQQTGFWLEKNRAMIQEGVNPLREDLARLASNQDRYHDSLKAEIRRLDGIRWSREDH